MSAKPTASRPPGGRESPFYPPRATPWSFLYWRMRSPLAASWSRLRPNRRFSDDVREMLRNVGGLLVPGYGWVLCGHRRTGWISATLTGVFLLLSISELGRPMGATALMIAMATHTLGASVYLERLLPEYSRARRIFATVATICGVCLLYYALFSRGVGAFVVPMQSEQHTYIVRREPLSTRELVRGRWVMFDAPRLEGHYRWSNTGPQFAPIVALAGDRLEFRKDGFTLNGVPQAPRRGMPAEASYTVPEGSVLVWPQYSSLGGNIAVLPDGLNLYTLPYEKCRGRVLSTWFWHHDSPQ